MHIDKTALHGAAVQVGDRWSLPIVAALLDGDKTFSELSTEVEGIAPNILTSRLRSLERDALIVSQPYQQRPLRMSYSLTATGRRLGDAVTFLAEWGARRHGSAAGPLHETCGASLELRPWCPTCESVVDTTDDADIVWI